MDVNGLPFRLLTGAADFGLSATASGVHVAERLAVAEQTGHVRLASEQAAPDIAEDETFARGMASQPSPVADEVAASHGGTPKRKGSRPAVLPPARSRSP